MKLDSSHIESVFNTQTDSSINLSTSEKIDDLIQKINDVHTALDETIQHRTQQISIDTESVLAHIINETHEEQQRLLLYAKERQTKQDESYREEIHAFMTQLDEKKLKELSHLQSELQASREHILQASQSKIMSVNEQANMAKSKIVKEEQQKASVKINSIHTQLQNLTTDKTFQQLDSEISTKSNVTATINIGSKSVGHSTSVEHPKDSSSKNYEPRKKSGQQTRLASTSDGQH